MPATIAEPPARSGIKPEPKGPSQASGLEGGEHQDSIVGSPAIIFRLSIDTWRHGC